jgi:type II secretory pathway predicted ATPase ExeA
VARALENLIPDSTYLEFFGFARPPFARISQPSQVFYTEQYSLLMTHLANATEHPDSRVAIFGADGSGKTTLLNRYISSLGDDICFASIDDTCKGEKQFYCTFLNQLGFGDISGTPHELRHITKEYLVNRGMAGDPVLIIIDNAHLISPTVLEQLRWISATKVDDRRVLSVVLAGNSDLLRIMGSPAMSQIEFRSHVEFNIRVHTEEETANYIRHRLTLAGGGDLLRLSSDAHPLIYRYTGGIPSLINMLCNAVLTQAHARESHIVTAEHVRAVADDRRLLPHVVPLQCKGRRRSDPDFKLVHTKSETGECIAVRDTISRDPADKRAPRPNTPDVDVNKLLEKASRHAEQLGELEADKNRARQDIVKRDKIISELHEQLNAQAVEIEKQAGALGENAHEIARQTRALSDSTKALRKSEKATEKLASDLEAARKVARTAQSEVAEGKATTAELNHVKSELLAKVSCLEADLELADERIVENDVLKRGKTKLEKETERMAGELHKLRGELLARDESLGGLEKLLHESQEECASLKPRAAALTNLEEAVSIKDARIAELQTELITCGEEILALEADREVPEARGQELAPEPHFVARQSDAAVSAFEIVRDGVIEQVMKVPKEKSRIMIGRSEDSELRLNSEFVSRHHALITCTEQGLCIDDLNSFNGTVVNFKKIAHCELQADDTVIIGDFRISVCFHQ